jgi:transposase, IS5 family
MPEQLSLATQADGGFEAHRKPTRRDVFLAEMDKVVPWAQLCAVTEPFYPKARAEGGRRPVGLERMLRIHFLQQWYALSDPAVEEALYDSASMRRFVGIDLAREPAPDETTVCKFRHLLEKHGLANKLFKAVNQHLHDHGLKLSQGTIVDATILGAASSTKKRAKARDPQMHQTKKGNQWYFGMKAHIGVDEATGLVHSSGDDGSERGGRDAGGATAARPGEGRIWRRRLHGC